ncbi:hypothetical protein DCM91_08165 [Chitinophaga costaii]|nr:hypothetical protein DCM91_08165 [Chitinophaga costaii]
MAVALLCLGSTAALAQLKRFSIGPYIETGAPAGDFHDTHDVGWGGGVNADIKLIAGLGITGSVGYMHFGGKTTTITNPDSSPGKYTYPNVSAIPIRVGVKYHFFPLLYVKVEGGVANFTNTKYRDGAAAIFAPGIGIRILMIDVEAKYELWHKDGSSGFWGLKAGVNF